MDELPPVAAAVAVVVVVGAVSALAFVGPALAASSADQSAGSATDQTTQGSSLAPGERLAGVVGVQQAELNGEVTARAFGRQVAAASNESKARIVGTAVENISERLAALAEEKRELQTARENGSIRTGQYRAQLAKIHTEQRALERLANETESVAAGLPRDTREANGVNVTAIRTLRTEARNLTGPETAAVARSITGRDVGNGVGPPENRGPDGDRGPPENESESESESDERGPPDDRGPPGNESESGEPGPSGDRGPPGNESESEAESESEGGNESEAPNADTQYGPGSLPADEAVLTRLAAARAA